MKPKKCCGTCVYWMRSQDPPSCDWSAPALPFWASIDNGDHGNYTEADQGTDCWTWERA